jgi:hypothetical protein
MVDVDITERPDKWRLGRPLTFGEIDGSQIAKSDSGFSLVLDKYMNENSVQVKYITGNVEGVQIMCKHDVGEARGKQLALFGLICIKLFLFNGVLMEEL